MKEKRLKDRWLVQTSSDGEKWYGQGGFDSFEEAEKNAVGMNADRNVRIIKSQRFLVKELKSEGKEIKHFGFSLSSLKFAPVYK